MARIEPQKGDKEMNKEEILKKSIEENRYLDEKQQNEVMQSFGFGGIIVALLCLFFCIMNAIKGKIFGYMAGYAWSSYRKTKKITFLIQAIAGTFVAILGFVSYFLKV